MSISTEQTEHRDFEKHRAEDIEELDAPWRSESILRRLYLDERMAQAEVGEKLGCAVSTISEWLHRHGIDTRGRERAGPEIDESTMRRLYVEENLSARAIGEKFGHSGHTILNWLRRYDIPLRGREGQRKERATYFVTPAGYGMWTDNDDGKTVGVYVHQLAAVANGADPAEVFADGTHVHHRANEPAMNVPGLLEVLNAGEHRRTHAVDDWTEERGFPVLETQRDGD